ncbi:MAG: GatB/YqeY domain-containing protein [candidate division Zixibacteria bacterium]
MVFLEKINNDLKAAMKTKDEVRLKTLRMLKSDLMYKSKESGGELSDEDILAVLTSAAKRRSEAIDEYRRGGRDDLVAEESAEFEIIKEFLPEQLSAEKLDELIDRAISEAEASSTQNFGAVMKLLMPEIKGRADGKAVNIAVKEKLMKK